MILESLNVQIDILTNQISGSEAWRSLEKSILLGKKKKTQRCQWRTLGRLK